MQIVADTVGSGITTLLATGTYFIQVEERGNDATTSYFLNVYFQGNTWVRGTVLPTWLVFA